MRKIKATVVVPGWSFADRYDWPCAVAVRSGAHGERTSGLRRRNDKSPGHITSMTQRFGTNELYILQTHRGGAITRRQRSQLPPRILPMGGVLCNPPAGSTTLDEGDAKAALRNR